MKLDEIEAFVAVVRSQSLSKAANSLALTQPAVTRRIQNFEEALGVALLDRNTKPLKTTPMGRAVYEQCRAIVRERGLNSAPVRELEDERDPVAVRLRVADPLTGEVGCRRVVEPHDGVLARLRIPDDIDPGFVSDTAAGLLVA